MKVVLSAEAAGRNSTWLVEDEAYPVLAVFNDSSSSKLLLWSIKQESIGLFPASDFIMVDGRLPSQWEVSINTSGYVEFSPKEWKSTGFWEAYHEGEMEAEQVFSSVANALVSDS